MTLRRKWDWDKYVTLHNKQHTVMDSLTYFGSFLKELRALSWRQQSVLFKFNWRKMARICYDGVLSWSDGHEKGLYNAIHPYC